MLSLVAWLQNLNDPYRIVQIGVLYIASYYVVSAFFHAYTKKDNYAGFWSKNGVADRVSSVLWCITAVVLILSLLDLVTRNELSLGYLLLYYVLFLFLFAFLYNILEWHFRGTVAHLNSGWLGELQCITMSLQIMTTGDYTSAAPAKPLSEFLAAVQSLLGVLFVAIVIAKAVAVVGS